MGEKIHQNVMMQTRQVQHKLKPESKCLWLIWGRFSTCCLWLLAPSISVVSLISYHWETAFLWICQGRDVPGSAVRVDAAYGCECWESPARMPRVRARAVVPGRNTWD